MVLLKKLFVCFYLFKVYFSYQFIINGNVCFNVFFRNLCNKKSVVEYALHFFVTNLKKNIIKHIFFNSTE